MKVSKFEDWEQGIFSVVNKIGGPDSTEPTYFYRRDDPTVPGYKHDNEYEIDGVQYVWNSYGFRSDEFEEDAPNYLFIGGSHTLCMAEPTCNSWPWLVRDALNKDYKCYNLSICSASQDYVARTLYKTIDVLKPSAVFIFQPAPIGQEFMLRGKLLAFRLIAMAQDPKKSAIKEWQRLFRDYSNQIYHQTKNEILIRELCAARNIPLVLRYSTQFDPSLEKMSDEEMIKIFSEVDISKPSKYYKCFGSEFNFPLARDSTHFGREWNHYIAKEFLEAYHKSSEKS